jgi:chromosome segregation ATPase
MLRSVTVTARQAWTDQRLDDLNARMETRFNEVDQRFDRVEGDIREIRAEVKSMRSEMQAGFQSLQRTMIVCFTGMTASLVAAVLGAAIVG